jgi:maltose operon protein
VKRGQALADGRRIARPAWAFALLLALAGCAVPLADQLDTLSRASVCCTQLSEFKYQKLTANETRSVSLDEKSLAYVFESGKSFFAAFELPTFSQPYTVSLYSTPHPAGNGRGTVLRPRIMLLDASFEITRTLADVPFRVGAGHALVKDFFVNRANRDERYLVVYTAPSEKETEKLMTFAPTGVMIGAVYLPIDGHQSEQTVSNAAVGSFTLKLKPYSPVVLGK